MPLKWMKSIAAFASALSEPFAGRRRFGFDPVDGTRWRRSWRGRIGGPGRLRRTAAGQRRDEHQQHVAKAHGVSVSSHTPFGVLNRTRSWDITSRSVKRSLPACTGAASSRLLIGRHMTEPNKYSSRITQPKSQGASQAMLYATGLTEADMNKPQVGIASVWYEGNPCNMHLHDLGRPRRRKASPPPAWSACGSTRSACQRRHLDGHRRDELLAAVARSHRRLDRDGHGAPSGTTPWSPSPAATRTCPAASWRWAGSIARRSWSTAARSAPAAANPRRGTSSTSSPRSRAYGQYIAGKITEDERSEIVAQVLPRRRRVRRHVHRQHDGRRSSSALGMSLPYSARRSRPRIPAKQRGMHARPAKRSAACWRWTSSRATS